MDLGYAVANTLTTNKPVTLKTRSPNDKPPPTSRLDTPNVRYPLVPGAAPAGGSPTYGPPSLTLGQTESCNLYIGLNVKTKLQRHLYVTNHIRTPNARNAWCRRLTYITQKTGRPPEKQEKGRKDGK